jgi:predicted  nucleic acid-binding Zn-ribbon protein
MLNATKQEQQALLELARLELELSRTNSALRVLDKNVEVVAARDAQLESAESLLDAHAKLERLQGELTKVLADIDLVNQRIVQDQLKAKAVNSERELKAVEAELESLATRKGLLEDNQLNLLQEIEDSAKSIELLTVTRSELNQNLEVLLKQVQDQVDKLGAQATELGSKRESVAKEISGSLLEAYRRKAERGVPVGQTLGRDCSACRLAINGVEFDAMMALPEDALPTCPNCDAFIIR